MSVVVDNRKRGADFEEIFKKLAGFQGILVLNNWLTGRYIFFKGQRQFQVIKGELDFKAIQRDGTVAYIDCKCFLDERFPYSVLDQHQIDRALMYGEWNVPSGFVVMFMKVNKLVFFTGLMISRKGPGSSFGWEDGIQLGSMTKCDLNIIFKKRGSRP